MKRNVLVLNGSTPIQIWFWQEAIENIFNEKCFVLESYEDFPLHSGSGFEVMKCPAVVILKEYINNTPTPKYSKDNVCQRDNYQCQYCGNSLWNPKEREIDHVIPKSHPAFPGTSFENVVLICTSCNRQKANKTLDVMKKEKCWNGKPFQLIKKPDIPKDRNCIPKFIMMVNKNNIMWLKYINNWEKYAYMLGKKWLFDEYEKYINSNKNN